MTNLTIGFADLNGNVWPMGLIDSYNRVNEQVEKRERQKPEYGSLAWKELEFYRDQRHRTFVQCCRMADVRFA